MKIILKNALFATIAIGASANSYANETQHSHDAYLIGAIESIRTIFESSLENQTAAASAPPNCQPLKSAHLKPGSVRRPILQVITLSVSQIQKHHLPLWTR